jgi:hypothetical protein
MGLNKEVNERLANFLVLDARSILKNPQLKKEYISLHLQIEGYEPSCAGCSAKSKLSKWRNKFEINSKKTKTMSTKTTENTFILKKNHPRLRVPFTGAIITQKSTDKLVHFYLNQDVSEAEKARRKSFFKELPKKTTKTEGVVEAADPVVVEVVENNLETARNKYKEKFGKEVSNRYKNDEVWIENKLAE